MESAIWWVLGVVVYPLWLASGACDYLIHRRQRIEASTGRREPVLHLAQALQLCVPVLLVLLFETSRAVVAVAWLAVVVHGATAWIDLRYAAARRIVVVAEQFAHAFLIVLPFAAACLLILLHLAEGAPRGLTLRDPRLPWPALAAVLGSGALVAVLPALLEWLRAVRAPGARSCARARATPRD